MGLISRLRRITMGKIEAFLDSIESPEILLPRLVEEMAEKVKLAANAEAKALTAVKSARRKLDEASGRAERMRKGASLAIKSNDSDTARKAIAAQMDAEADMERLSDSLRVTECAREDARDVRIRLSEDLEQLRSRKVELIARARAVGGIGERKSISDLLDEGDGVLDAVMRMEESVEQRGTEVEVQCEINRLLGGDVERYRIEDLQRDEEVQRRLNEMMHGME